MLKNKVIVLTGGAGLLGQAFAKEIVKNNGCVVIADIDKVKGYEVVTSIRKEFSANNIEFYKMDITSKVSINSLIEDVVSRYNHIDAFVNNAYPRNGNYGRHFFDVEYSDFCENLGLNLGGYFLTSQLFAKHFIENGFGNIVNISSIYGSCVPRFEVYNGTKMTMPVEYAVIKSGLNHLTKYLAKYLFNTGVRCNSLSPGGILDSQPSEFVSAYNSFCGSKGMLSSYDICGALVFLLSENSKYINGQDIIVDDGYGL